MSAPETRAAAAHPLAGWLRARVQQLRASTRRRTFPGSVELVAPRSEPGRPPLAAWTYGFEELDHGLRVDALARLLDAPACRTAGRVSLVHVRPGVHEHGDGDAGWAAALGPASDVGGVPVAGPVLVSRWGWHDMETGAGRTWVRLRPPGC